MQEEKLFDTSPYGQFYVSTEIVRFIVDITAPKSGEKVLGIGVIDPPVLSSAVEARNNAQLTYIKGHPTLEELDSLDDDYPVILCAPPFGLSLARDPGRPGESSEEFWLKWSIAHLSRNGRLAIIVPAGLLSNYSSQPIRRFLLEEGGLQAILELPAGWAASTATQASILFITSDRELRRPVRMFRFFSAEAIPWVDLASYVLAAEPTLPQEVGKAYTVTARELDSLRLDTQYYDPKYTQIPTPDPAIFEEVKLGDLVEIRSGDRFSKEHLRPEGIPFVQVGNVTADGNLSVRNARTVNPDIAASSRGYSHYGDILMTIAGTVGKVAFLGDQTPTPGVCIDTSLRRLRVHDKDRVLPEYLALYLRSRLAQLQIERRLSGSVIETLSNPNLREITVYLPDPPTQQEIVKSFQGFSHELVDHLLSRFPDTDQMGSAVDRYETEDLPGEEVQPRLFESFRPSPPPPSWKEVVQDEFPFPIARALTVFENDSLPFTDRFQALIDVSEAVVYYVYGVLLADQLRNLRLDDSKLQERVETSLTSYSIERHLQFIFRMQTISKENPDVALFIPELVDARIGICSEIHNRLRNPYAHRAKTPEPQCRKAVEEYTPKLESLFESLMPLRNYKLAQITQLNIRAGRFQHTIVSMMGNNSLFQPQVEDLEDPLPADTGHIIIIDQDYNCLDLHPFYLLHAWESTAMHPHLCFSKHMKGSPPNLRLVVESTLGVGDTETETDLGLSDLLATGIM